MCACACVQAVRAFFTYGFVPWVVRRLDKDEGGDEIPEVLCNGTFHWFTEVPSRNPSALRQQKNTGLVAYRVQITAPLIEVTDSDVEIFVHTAPALDVSTNSMIYATVPSPLSHILADYKNLRQAQIRRSHADSWNTTAKLICAFKPTVRVQVGDSFVVLCFYGQIRVNSSVVRVNPSVVRVISSVVLVKSQCCPSESQTDPSESQTDPSESQTDPSESQTDPSESQTDLSESQ
jgi:hypothetical protein